MHSNSKPEEYSTTAIEGTAEAFTADLFTVFRGCAVEGRWDYVVSSYENDSVFHKIKINESRGTALHVAVNDGNVEQVNHLVGAIIEHEGREIGGASALRSTDERGDTPLHLAASRGFIGMCKCIIGEKGERKDLIKAMNNKGETPVFRAVLMCQTETFVYLHDVSKPELDVPLRNKEGDSILHRAIRGEFFDLAIIIIDCYPGLVDTRNKDGVTPLKTLATRTSAFKSGSNLSWWRQILYQCILVEHLDAKKAIKSYLEMIDKSEDHEHKGKLPMNYLKCYEFFVEAVTHIGLVHVTISDNIEAKEVAKTRVVPNFVTSLRSTYNTIQSAYSTIRSAFSSRDISRLDISIVDIKALKKMKQKHVWGNQLLKAFMEKPYESYMGITGGQPFEKDDLEDKDVTHPFISRRQLESMHSKISKKEIAGPTQKPQENMKELSAEVKIDEKETTFLAMAKTGIVEIVNELQTKIPSDQHGTTPDKEGLLLVAVKNIKNKSTENVDKKETAYLTAAKNGIVEIVHALQSKIPSAVHETNSNNENVLLAAVKNRQPHVVEVLRKNLDKELFNSLILEVDNKENTVLHLAAGTSSNNEKSWRIAGAAMQMMWDIKWYQYIKELVPEHFIFRNNRDDKTAGEIFKDKHKDLVKNSSEWLKETSESCSVVAALIAGVSFATSSTVPGGTEKGKPELEGQPAFDTFAIASLIGLCFSVTALVMFLAILTSRKQAEDFRRTLPLKLLFGLSSLFVSIASMLVSFCAAHFFVLKDKFKNILFPIYVATCLPVTFYAVVQFPLYADLVKAIFMKVPQPSYKSDHL